MEAASIEHANRPESNHGAGDTLEIKRGTNDAVVTEDGIFVEGVDSSLLGIINQEDVRESLLPSKCNSIFYLQYTSMEG